MIRDLTAPGSYQLAAAEGTTPFQAGVSLNYSEKESDLRRLEISELDAVLGEGRYSISRDPAGLERTVHSGRLGQEVYGIVVGLLAILFALEQFTSTWFYRADES